MKPIAIPKIDFQEILSDFRAMNPNDPGAWALVPKVVVLVAIFFSILVAGWFLLWSDQLAELDSKAREEDLLKQQFLEKKQQAVNLDLYIQQLDEIDRSFGALLKQLPDKSEIESLLIEVNQAGLGRGVQFELFKPGKEQIMEFYAELPIAVRVSGGYHDFGAFAADIAKLPRIVTLNNISISTAKDSGNSLVLDATTKTFRYLDEEEVVKRKQAKNQKSGKGS